MASNLHEIARRIDWKMLRNQKLWLLKHEPAPSATGLICLIDAIQDAALLDQIADEHTIFGPPKIEGTPNDC
jgi:hypothetical protein